MNWVPLNYPAVSTFYFLVKSHTQFAYSHFFSPVGWRLVSGVAPHHNVTITVEHDSHKYLISHSITLHNVIHHSGSVGRVTTSEHHIRLIPMARPEEHHYNLYSFLRSDKYLLASSK